MKISKLSIILKLSIQVRLVKFPFYKRLIMVQVSQDLHFLSTNPILITTPKTFINWSLGRRIQ